MLGKRNPERNGGYFWPGDREIINRVMAHLKEKHRLMDKDDLEMLTQYSFGMDEQRSRYKLTVEKGIQQGIELGEERGIEKGRNEGKLESAHTQRPPLVQYPVDVGGKVTREATLLFGQSKPARDEKVFLRFRANQPVLTGQL